MRNAAKVLIVDDDKSSSQMLSEVVKRMGLKPIVANKPIDALNVVKLQTVHAALVDVLLPKMSGVDLVAEFRQTKFGDAPVVLVSGVFKDRGFAADALKKTGAVDFLFKPFSVDELIVSLQAAFKDAINVEKWNVQSLLTRKMPSARERAKALEHLDSITGNDFPFVLGLLLEGSISGHLNIVNESGEIFGATVTRGTITDIDSSESQSAGVLALIAKGFLNQQDWEEFQRAGNKKFTMDRLVQEGYVSPHAVAVAKHEQILADLKAICAAEQLKLNFGSADTEETPPKHAVEMPQLLSEVFAAGDEFFKSEYLKKFYSVVEGASMQLAVKPEILEVHWKEPMFAGMTKLREVLNLGGTLKEVLQAEPDKADAVYRAVHFLVLHRDLMFADLGRAKDLTAARDRYAKLFSELSNRSADQVFEYFGAPPMAQAKVVESLFEQYSKSNDPNRLPPELKEIAEKCLTLVRNARDVMVDEFKRIDLVERKKSAGAEAHKKTNELIAKALEQLRKSQPAKAVELLNEADKTHPTTLSFLIGVWAGIKAGAFDKNKLMEKLKKLETLPQDDRQSAYYFMAMGMVKKALVDPTAAGFFEKAVAIDAGFTEARRELNVLETAAKDPKNQKVDLLTGDITAVISQLFRKKAD